MHVLACQTSCRLLILFAAHFAGILIVLRVQSTTFPNVIYPMCGLLASVYFNSDCLGFRSNLAPIQYCVHSLTVWNMGFVSFRCVQAFHYYQGSRPSLSRSSTWPPVTTICFQMLKKSSLDNDNDEVKSVFSAYFDTEEKTFFFQQDQ